MMRAVLAALLLALPAAAAPAPRQAMMISWFEIPATDLARARRFYEAVFAVTMAVTTIDGYAMALFPDESGALVQGDVYVPGKAGPILYFRVASIDEVMARAIAAGGQQLYAKKDIGPNGFVAEFQDSEGNRIALSQPR
jgi:predicted enzyme related to lactoylglutathione lyase